jgi:lipopolysaccharide exporter
MNKFATNVAIMSFAPLITQALSIAITPIITRLYSPEDFGLFALFGAIVSPIAIFANLGYNTAIVVPDEEDEANKIFVLNVILTLIFSSILLLFLVFFNKVIFDRFNLSVLQDLVFLIPIAVIIHGLYSSVRYLNIRNEKYWNLSIAKIFRFLSDNITTLSFGFLNLGSGVVLIVAGLIGGTVSLLTLSRTIISHIKSLSEHISLQTLLVTAKKYSNFPKYLIINDFVSRISSQMPIYIISLFYSDKILGFYALSLRLLSVPMNFLGNSIGEVFFQNAAEDKHNIPSILRSLFKYLVLLGVPGFSIIMIFGEDIFILLFGQEWSDAGKMSQILSLSLFSKFIIIPASYLILIYDDQHMLMNLNISSLILGAIALIFGGMNDNLLLSVILYSVIISAINFVYGFYAMNRAGLHYKEVFRMLVIYGGSAIPLLMAFVIIDHTSLMTPLNKLVTVLIVSIAYYVIAFFRMPESVMIMDSIRKKIH